MTKPASTKKQRPKIAMLASVGVLLTAGALVLRVTWKPPKPVPPPPDKSPEAQQLVSKLTTLKRNLELNPKSAAAHSELALLYLDISQPEKAAVLLEAAIQIDPSRESDMMELANLYLAASRPKRAQQLFQSIVDKGPDNIPALQGLAVSHHKQGRYLDAMKVASRARKLKPDDNSTIAIDAAAKFEYVMQFPDPELAIADLIDATKDMEKLTLVFPDNGLMRIQLGRALIQIREFRRAIVHLREAVRLLPKSADAVYYLARAYVMLSNRDDALKTFETAFAQGMSHPALHDSYAQLVQQLPDPVAQQKALDSFALAVKGASKIVGYRERYATALMRAGRLPEAKAQLEEAVFMDSNRSSLFQQLSVVYARLGDKSRAKKSAEAAKGVARNENQLKQFESLAKQYPGDIRIKLLLADRYLDLKQNRAAEDLYLATLEIDPKNTRAKAGLAKLATSKSEVVK